MSQTLNALQLLEKEELGNLLESLGVEWDGAEFSTGEMPEEVVNRFKIYDLNSLNWVLRKRDARLAELAAIKQLANDELNRINAWQEKASKAPEGSIKFFDFLIQEYMQQQRKDNPDWKKQTTPYGEIGYHKQAIQWTYPDEQKFIQFLKSREDLKDLVKASYSEGYNKNEVKKAFEAKYNVFVKDGKVVDIADGDTKTGMRYKVIDEVDTEIIVDMAGADPAEGVTFAASVVVYGNEVVPGVVLQEQPDKPVIKGAK